MQFCWTEERDEASKDTNRTAYFLNNWTHPLPHRLVGNRSIGIGGHINPVDDMPLFSDFRETYLATVKREVAEEVRLDSDYTDRIVALINDDSTEVGQVHLGIVHFWELSSANVSKHEQVITQMTFMSPSELEAARETLEKWSQLCLDNLANFVTETSSVRSK